MTDFSFSILLTAGRWFQHRVETGSHSVSVSFLSPYLQTDKGGLIGNISRAMHHFIFHSIPLEDCFTANKGVRSRNADKGQERKIKKKNRRTSTGISREQFRADDNQSHTYPWSDLSLEGDPSSVFDVIQKYWHANYGRVEAKAGQKRCRKLLTKTQMRTSLETWGGYSVGAPVASRHSTILL
jgi:hypothetical protein